MPEILREAMSSEINSDIVWKAAENEHLAEEKIVVVSKFVGYVLMGFIHPEDLAREIKENLGIDIRIATSIADPINKKIFQPLRQELETIYSPTASGAEALATEEGEQAMSPQPVLIDSISSQQVEKIIKPGPASSVPKFFQTGQIPKPATPPQALVPKPVTQPAFTVSLSNPPAAAPTAVPSAPSTGSGQAAPFMLHTESKSQPLSPSKSGFKIGLSEEQFGKMEQKWAAPPRPAQIETGFTPQQKPEVRTVHYSEMRTPVAPALSRVDSINSFDTAQDKLPQVEALASKLPTQNKIGTPMPDKSKIPAPPSAQQKKVDVPMPNKVEKPVPSRVEKIPAVPQAPLQKSAEPAKQKDMLQGKPQELELPEPHK